MLSLRVLIFVIGAANCRQVLRTTHLAGTLQVDNGRTTINNGGDYPYVAHIFEDKKRLCPATIVGPKTVLTAGSCFGKIGRNAKVVAGTITNKITRTTQAVAVEKVIQHKCADLTVIVTANKFEFDKYVHKVKLATTTQRDRNINRLVTIVGFNMVHADHPATLHWADVKLLSQSECKTAIQGTKIPLTGKLCVLGAGKDVAIGKRDYGAPLVKIVEGKAYLLGVASHVFSANNQPSTKHPTIYTDVTELAGFIENPFAEPTGCFGR